VAQEGAADGPPTKGAGPGAMPRWPFVLGVAAFSAAFSAYGWWTPHEGGSLRWFVVDLTVFAIFAGIYLFHFARHPFLLPAIWLVVPSWVVGLIRRVVQLLAGGWAGGWALGAVGAALGCLAGIVFGRLWARWFVTTLAAARIARGDQVGHDAGPPG
jgi:hypothetical protein